MASNRLNVKLDAVPDVIIDNGFIYYVLLKVHDGQSTGADSKYIVRGYAGLSYEDMVERVEDELKGLKAECVGGSRLIHSSQNRDVVFCDYESHSKRYGRVDCDVAQQVIQRYYPDYQINRMEWL